MRGCGLDWSDSDKRQEASCNEQCIEPLGDTTCEQLLTGWWTVNFSRSTLLQGVCWLVRWFNNSPQAVPLYAKQAQRGGGGIALPQLTLVLEGCGWIQYTLAALPAGRRLGIHFTGGWVSRRSSLFGNKKFWPLRPGFKPQTGHLVAIHHIDWAILVP